MMLSRSIQLRNGWSQRVIAWRGILLGTHEETSHDKLAICGYLHGSRFHNPYYFSPSPHHCRQIRYMGRRSGASAFSKPRPPTRKQRKSYYKKKREIFQEKVGKHSKPGTKAGPRREIIEKEWQHLLDRAKGKIPDVSPDQLEYDFGDAIVDELMGNSSDLTSSPNPMPRHLGHKYETYKSIVSEKIQNYMAEKKRLNGKEKNEEYFALTTPLPSDRQISSLLLSYRDKKSSRSKPLGIANALQHLLTEMKIPSTSFGDRTYNALMSCAASPSEARRIMKMMHEKHQPANAYTYSILVNTHAKCGDFRGADEAISEMRFKEIEPTLAAYTSLLTACYKVINTGAIPTSIKAEAGVLAWDRWKEMRIIGLNADVMAYGAIIRVMAARGLPERAINIIEEMQAMDVKPTTLIFSSALRAVARSHANALRFEGGKSKKNKRRESITSHHGKMAQEIVILAENAEVKHDDGFVSALMLCAGTAGDSATTKAIYLASEVINIEDKHLKELRGLSGDSHSFPRKLELGESNTMTQVTHLDGEFSGNIPRRASEAIPDNQVKTSSSFLEEPIHKKFMTWEEREYGNDTRKLSALLYANARAIEIGGLGNMWSGHENRGYLCANSLRLIIARENPKMKDTSIPGMSSVETGLSAMVWGDENLDKMSKGDRRKKFTFHQNEGENTIDELDPELARMIGLDETNEPQVVNNVVTSEFKWEKNTGEWETIPSSKDINNIAEEEYQQMYTGEGPKPIEIEDDSNIDVLITGSGHKLEQDINEEVFIDKKDEEAIISLSLSDKSGNTDISGFDQFQQESKGDKMKKNLTLTENDETNKLLAGLFDKKIQLDGRKRAVQSVNNVQTGVKLTHDDIGNSNKVLLDHYSGKLDELDALLEGFPKKRIEKVRKVMKSNFGIPSMLQLVPILRENMPELISKVWLKRKNLLDANFVMHSATKRGIVDKHLLTSMLEVIAKNGSFDKAFAFYEDEFSKRGIEPTAYCDRILLQMLIDNKRISRALEFKEKIQSNGKNIDLVAYGSLIEHYGNHGKLGSAILTLKECISVHGSPPGEKSLANLRLMCRQQGVEKEVEFFMGKDPLEWLKDGEQNRKREYSRKGREQIDLPSNRLLQI